MASRGHCKCWHLLEQDWAQMAGHGMLLQNEGALLQFYKWNGTCFEAPDVPSTRLANVFKDLHGATSQSAQTCQNYPDISRSSFERPSATNCQNFRVCRSLSQQTQRHIENMSVHVSASLCWQLCRAQITANIKLLTRVSSAFWCSMSPTQGLGYPGLRLPLTKPRTLQNGLCDLGQKTTLNSNPYIIYRHFSLQNGSCISHGILTRWQGLHVHFWAKYTPYKMTSHFGVLKLIYYKMGGFPPSNHYKMDLENPVYMGLDSSPFYRGKSSLRRQLVGGDRKGCWYSWHPRKWQKIRNLQEHE